MASFIFTDGTSAAGIATTWPIDPAKKPTSKSGLMPAGLSMARRFRPCCDDWEPSRRVDRRVLAPCLRATHTVGLGVSQNAPSSIAAVGTGNLACGKKDS